MDAALKEALDQQTRATETLVQRTLEETGQAVTRTGESITRQLEALDEAQAGEMERVMQRMGNALGQITDRFTDDYVRLVQEMERIVRTRPHDPGSVPPGGR